MHNKPVVLTILDGWGIAPPSPGNAISQAKTPNMTSFWQEYTHTQLIAHGESVGLPKREPGNTETGHLNLGAGRIAYQDLPRINISIADGSFFQNPALLAAIKHVSDHQSRLHIMSLVGGGGVHSDLSHFFALLRLCHEQNTKSVFLHIFTDGRDSPPTSSLDYVKQLQAVMTREGVGKIASVCGRFYAMDRDFRWDRTKKTYEALTENIGKTAPDIETAIKQSYDQNQTDEFIEPTLIVDENKNPIAKISDNDAVIFANFRIDRPRQLTKAFVLTDFDSKGNTIDFDPYAVKYTKKHADEKDNIRPKPFTRNIVLKNLFFVTLTEYEKDLPVHPAFPPQAIQNTLAETISSHSASQLHMSESEKERFVTYYFNGLKEQSFPGENRLIIPSPKVSTYDKKPEMSAVELTNRLISEIQAGTYDFIVVNFANADMVGHTGNIKSTTQACEVLDTCIGRVKDAILASDGVLIITADHGNAEEMLNLATNTTDTEHNANPVPLIIIGNEFKNGKQLPQGILADVAPTVLQLMKLPIPFSMSGRNLLS